MALVSSHRELRTTKEKKLCLFIVGPLMEHIWDPFP